MMGNSFNKKTVIIVGAGTAGAVICSKLSSTHDVTIFEKSENKRIPFLNRIPLLIGLLYSSRNKYIRKNELDFNSTRKVPFFESNNLGGSSVMNGCVHVLGIYSKWEKFLKKFNLELEDMEKAEECFFSRKNERKKISLRTARQANLDHAFQSAFQKKNIQRGKTDLMIKQACGPTINTTRKLLRSSVLDLNPFSKTKVVLNKKVTNLLLNDEGEVIGVVADGDKFFADKVILTAGVIGTNELLLRPALREGNLEKLSLKLQVGEGIKDHVNLRINVRSKKHVESLNIINASLIRKVWMLTKQLLSIETLLIGTGATSSANIDIDGDGVIDTRINLLNFSEHGRLGSDGNYFDDSINGFSFSISTINPLSSGYIKISETGECIVRPNYLQDKTDEKSISNAIDLCISLLKSPPLSDYVVSIKEEDKIVNDKIGFIRDNSYSGYHLIGGCHNIIDENFKVNDLNNLYICDASIFSEYVSSNIHASIVIVANLFSDKFLKLRNKHEI